MPYCHGRSSAEMAAADLACHGLSSAKTAAADLARRPHRSTMVISPSLPLLILLQRNRFSSECPGDYNMPNKIHNELQVNMEHLLNIGHKLIECFLN
jgi:hypothetical protein